MTKRVPEFVECRADELQVGDRIMIGDFRSEKIIAIWSQKKKIRIVVDSGRAIVEDFETKFRRVAKKEGR